MKKIILCSVIFLLSKISIAQELLTLDQAIQIGLQNNYGILMAKNNAQIASNNNTLGNAGFLPTLDVDGAITGSINNTDQKYVNGTELSKTGANATVGNIGAIVNWTIFDGMEMFAAKSQLKILEQSGDLEMKTQMENTIQQIMNSYYEILLRQYLLKTFIEQRDVSFFRKDLLQSRFDVGNAAEVEVIKATVDFNGDQFAVTNQEAEVAKAKVNLNQLIARDVNIDFSIDTTITLNQNFTYDQLLSDMFAHNKDLLLTEQNVQLATLDIKRSNAAYYPMVAVNGGYNFLKSKSEAGFVSSNQNQSIYYGATLSWNLFDGLNSRREKQNAVITQKNSELQKEDVQLQLTSYLKQLFLDYQNNIGLVDLERKNLTYAEKNLDIAQESFKLGVTSDLELREVQKNLVNAKVRLSGAAYQAKLQEAALMRMTGKLVE